MPPSKASTEPAKPASAAGIEGHLTAAWLTRGPLAVLLFPLSLIFTLLAGLRLAAYRLGLHRAKRLPVPVVVVGNITAGGAGKTPLTLYLATQLHALGRQPGIVSRGYGRKAGDVREVRGDSTAAEVGDEPLLLRRRSGCPVFVGRDRAAAGRALLAVHPECDMILCDDGLQYYALARDVEIAVVDRRGLMNGWRLPAGPLRESPRRLIQVDAVVLNGLAELATPSAPVFRMRLVAGRFYRLDDPTQTCDASALSGLRLHAVAGIGEPQRFFDQLAQLGLACVPHAFPDHHAYTASDLEFDGDAVLTTEKDAVKFAPFLAALPAQKPVWVLPVAAGLEPDLARFVLEKIDGRPPA